MAARGHPATFPTSELLLQMPLPGYFRMTFRAFVLLLIACVFVGCGKRDEIMRYELPKPPKVEAKDRMLVGIAFDKGSGWFFKVAGDLAAVEKQADSFQEFLKSVRFSPDSAKPTWIVPEGWTEIPSTGDMRAATFLLGEENPIELSVTSFPFRGDEAEGLLMNVNRWEGQMSLEHSQASELKDRLKAVAGAKEQILLLDISGVYKGGMSPGGGAPFMNTAASQPRDSRPANGSAANESNAEAEPEIDFQRPEGWDDAPPRPFAKYTLARRQGDQQATITISPLKKTNEWPANVEMWQNQMGIDQLSPEELDAKTSSIEVGGEVGKLISIESPESGEQRQALVAAMVVHGENAWFFKLIGDRDLVLEQKPSLEALLKSVAFK